jgi:hypothetical protein
MAAATLAVWALFQPARRRLQAAVDRRFNRRRYDAAQTIERFSERLHQQVDLEHLTVELLAVVEETMQPTRHQCGFVQLRIAIARRASRRNATDPAMTPCTPCTLSLWQRCRSVASAQGNGPPGVP